jgi:hypothetical protein
MDTEENQIDLKLPETFPKTFLFIGNVSENTMSTFNSWLFYAPICFPLFLCVRLLNTIGT